MFFFKGILDFLTIWFRRPKFLVMIGVMLFCAYTMLSVYGVRVVTDIPVYVVDHDNSSLSRTIRLFLDAGPDLRVLGSLESLEDAEPLLLEGKIGGIIYIPEGLSQAVKTQSGGHVMAYVDGTNMLMAKNVDKAVQTVVKTVSVGASMIAIQKQGMPKQALMGAMQPISLDVEKPFNAMTLYSEYLLPVLIFFCLNIFTCVMTCACFQEKVPDAILAHKLRKRFFYIGRLVVVFIVAFLIGVLIYQKGLPRVDIMIQAAPIMALSSLLIYILNTMLLFMILYLSLPGSLAMSLSYLTCMLSVMFSGLTWPIEMMPWYIQEITTWIPMTPFLQSVQVYLYHDATWGDLWEFYRMFVKQLIVFAIVLFCVMRLHDIKLIVKWAFHKLRHENTIPDELEAAAASASPKLSSLLLDEERDLIRSSQMLQAVSRSACVVVPPGDDYDASKWGSDVNTEVLPVVELDENPSRDASGASLENVEIAEGTSAADLANAEDVDAAAVDEPKVPQGDAADAAADHDAVEPEISSENDAALPLSTVERGQGGEVEAHDAAAADEPEVPQGDAADAAAEHDVPLSTVERGQGGEVPPAEHKEVEA